MSQIVSRGVEERCRRRRQTESLAVDLCVLRRDVPLDALVTAFFAKKIFTR
jgi:hypothetical protein